MLLNMQQIIGLWRKGYFLPSTSSLSFPGEIWKSFLCFSPFATDQLMHVLTDLLIAFLINFSFHFAYCSSHDTNFPNPRLFYLWFHQSVKNKCHVYIYIIHCTSWVLELCLAAQRYNELRNLQHLRWHFSKDPAKQIVVLGFRMSYVSDLWCKYRCWKVMYIKYSRSTYAVYNYQESLP